MHLATVRREEGWRVPDEDVTCHGRFGGGGRAEAAAVELAGGTGSELHVVYVVPATPELPYPRSYARERSEAELERRRLRGLRVIDERVRRIEAIGGSVAATHYREGRPEKEIVGLADELGAGLIITGGKRRPWYERIFEKGLSERISRRAGRPVIVVNENLARSSAVPG